MMEKKKRREEMIMRKNMGRKVDENKPVKGLFD
jgi:hypothetical protein